MAIGNGSNGHGFTVQSNAVVKIPASASGNQIINGPGFYVVPILNAGGVFDVNIAQTLAGLAMTNGVLRNSAAGTTIVLTITPTAGVHGTNAVILGDVSNLFDVPTSDAELDIAGEVTGSGSLVKTGLGVVNLKGTNSYTGNTTISNGTLVINFPFLSTNSTVTVNTNATLGTNGVLTLNFAGSETNVVVALVLGGVSKPAGVYSATTDPLYITGSGSLQVIPLSTINPHPGPIQFSVSGSTLNLWWPTNANWLLQAQTNSLQVGLGTNWVTVPGSDTITNLSVTINPTNGSTFYRLKLP